MAGKEVAHVESDSTENQDDFALEHPLGRPGLSARALINIVSVAVALMVIGVGAAVALRANPAWLQRIFPYTGARVYVVPDDSHTVLALKATDGTPAWTFALPAPSASVNAVPVAATLLGDATLYVATATGTGAAIIAINTRDGTQRWRYQREHLTPEHLYSDDGVLLVTGAQQGGDPQARDAVATLIALNMQHGTERWRYAAPQAGALTIATAPQAIVVGLDASLTPSSASAVLTALRPGDGARLWQQHFDTTQALYPTIAGAVVYVRADHSLTAYDVADGAQLWRMAVTAPLEFGAYPFVQQNIVALRGGDGTLTAFNATGALLWHVDVQGAMNVAVADQAAFFVETSIFTADDAAYTLNAVSATDGSTNWQFSRSSADAFSEPPLLAGAIVYLHLADAVVALNAGDGSARWRAPVARPPAGTPLTLAQGTLYLGAGNAIVALDAAGGKLRWQTRVGYVALAPLVGA